MKERTSSRELNQKIATLGLLTALSTVLSLVRIPIVGNVTVTLVLPVVVVGAALYGPLVGAWLTVIPNLISLTEAGMFITNSPIGCIITMLLKGILAGLLAGIIYKLLSKKLPTLALILASIIVPVTNSGIFVLGCYLFIWEDILGEAANSGVGIGMLLLGLAGINFVIELILNCILCPATFRIIKMVKSKKKS